MTNKKLFIIFGATGDLTKRKLIPAFYNLFNNSKISKNFTILGASNTKYTNEEYKEKSIEFIKNFCHTDKTKINQKFLSKISYTKINLTKINDYKQLLKKINLITTKNTELIFYLAIPPQLFKTVLTHLDKIGLNKNSKNKIKIIFEKPFGFDLKSAKDLNEKLMTVYNENQIYRIDHYLGKDAVQNFQAVRFSNSILEPIWNNKYIDNIQITAFEELGVEQRAIYYDKAGALRDMVQNHILQMLAYIAMEPPTELTADKIRNEKVKIFSSIKNIGNYNANDVVFGQYTKGKIQNKKVIDYLDEKNIKKTSKTETFVAAKFEINNWRWSGVPFYIRTGKRMNKKGTIIVIEFKKLPSILYNQNNTLEPNKLIIQVQPNASIDMIFNIKSLDSKYAVTPVLAEFDKKQFNDLNSHEAYENLFLEILKSDQSLFTRWDGVEASWKIVDSMVNCKKNCPIIHKYKSGTTGPSQSDKLLKKDGKQWHNI